MRKNFFKPVALGLMALLALTSCGSDKAAGTGEFATVFAAASATSGQLDSDVARWTGEVCGVTSTISTLPDTVDYTITSTAYSQPNTGSSSSVTPSPLLLNRVTLTLTPADTLSPALPARFAVQFPSSSAPLITPGTTTVPVRIVDNDLKEFFLLSLGTQSLSCSNRATYSYRAVVSFELLEVNTNRVSTVTAGGFLLVKVSDFIDA